MAECETSALGEWKLALDPITYRPMPGFDRDAFYQFRNGSDPATVRSGRFRDFHPLANVYWLEYRDPIAGLRP